MNGEAGGQRMDSGSCSQVLLRLWMPVRRKQTDKQKAKATKRSKQVLPSLQQGAAVNMGGAIRPMRAEQDLSLWFHNEGRWIIEILAFNTLFSLISSLSCNPQIPLDVKRRCIMTLKFTKAPILKLQPQCIIHVVLNSYLMLTKDENEIARTRCFSSASGEERCWAILFLTQHLN